MSTMALTIATDVGRSVSAFLRMPEADPAAALVLAHGAGAGMTHPFMQTVADGLAGRDIATLRFNFLFSESGSRRPDPAPVARTVVRAAIAEAGRLLPGVPLFAGGKSFGGRMTSQAQAEAALPGVRGLVFLGFPLHPAGKPSTTRAEHLAAVQIPMLLVQGERDGLADLALIRRTIAALGPAASLFVVSDGDHAFQVRRSSGRTNGAALDEALDQVAAWMKARTTRAAHTP